VQEEKEVPCSFSDMIDGDVKLARNHITTRSSFPDALNRDFRIGLQKCEENN